VWSALHVGVVVVVPTVLCHVFRVVWVASQVAGSWGVAVAVVLAFVSSASSSSLSLSVGAATAVSTAPSVSPAGVGGRAGVVWVDRCVCGGSGVEERCKGEILGGEVGVPGCVLCDGVVEVWAHCCGFGSCVSVVVAATLVVFWFHIVGRGCLWCILPFEASLVIMWCCILGWGWFA
jgi:hypothetical protein